MYKFSEKSLRALKTCDPRLKLVCHSAIQAIDFSVIFGWRGEAEQNRLFELGRSRRRWPESDHNFLLPDGTPCSRAVDLQPYPMPKSKARIREEFFRLAGVIRAVSYRQVIPIGWGGDWRGSWDLYHFYLPTGA